MATTAPALMTTEDLLAMPDDGVERWLIRGELRECRGATKELPMTVRNRFHSRVMIRMGQLLLQWLDRQPEPRGQILGGEVGIVLKRNPDTTVGVDVAYVSAEVAERLSDDTTLIDGVPTLTVEILSPSDTQQNVHDKIDEYL